MTTSNIQVPYGEASQSACQKRSARGCTEVAYAFVSKGSKETKSLANLQRAKLLKGISYCRIQVKRLEEAGKFPKRIKSGARRYWYEHEVDEWNQNQADARS